jgi:GTP-binding protein
MKVLEARFVTSAVDARGIPGDGVPHIALVGRSNVGKSSLINALVRAKLARTSAAPGKTRLANLYRLTVEGGHGGPGRWSVYLADLPGYGYARGGDASVAELARVAAAYFQLDGVEAVEDGRRNTHSQKSSFDPSSIPSIPSSKRRGHVIAGVLHLVDARHPRLEPDSDAAEWLAGLGLERAVVAMKIDKLSRGERAKNLRELERTLGTAVLPVSAVSGEGLDDLWTLIAKLSRRP